jgi:hypothetical protein
MNPEIIIRKISETNTYPESYELQDVRDWIEDMRILANPLIESFILDSLEKPTINVEPGLKASLSSNVDYVGSDKLDFNFKSVECTNDEYLKLNKIINSGSKDLEIIYVPSDLIYGGEYGDDYPVIFLKGVRATLKLNHQSNDWSTIEIYGSISTRNVGNILSIHPTLKDTI